MWQNVHNELMWEKRSSLHHSYNYLENANYFKTKNLMRNVFNWKRENSVHRLRQQTERHTGGEQQRYPRY